MKNIIRDRICPENGQTIKIIQTEEGRGEPYFVDNAPEAFSDGMILLFLVNQLTGEAKENGVIEFPEGVTAQIFTEDDNLLAQVEVHRNGSPPMYKTPEDPKYHHIDGESSIEGTPLPDPLNIIASVWKIILE